MKEPHPNCEGRQMHNGVCSYPYCFDWSFTEEQHEIIRRSITDDRSITDEPSDE